MSFRVLVVPEDPIQNGYILKPLVERICQECGRANAKVTVLTNPRAKGYEHAKELLRTEVLTRYTHYDLLLFLPDADGKNRTAEFLALEENALSRDVRLICCAAIQEVEIWLLAGHADQLSSAWNDIRADVSVKENVFVPFLEEHGDSRRAGRGRDVLMQQALRRYRSLLRRCPELSELENRIRAICQETS